MTSPLMICSSIGEPSWLGASVRFLRDLPVRTPSPQQHAEAASFLVFSRSAWKCFRHLDAALCEDGVSEKLVSTEQEIRLLVIGHPNKGGAGAQRDAEEPVVRAARDPLQNARENLLLLVERATFDVRSR